ncbi:MAG: phosphotransferase family protein [Halioglobus sp.]|nr:phosphotransferase family protein [Halioglobus sp.]
MPNEFEQALAALLAREYPGFTSLDECQQLSAGASQETYRIGITTRRGNKQIALRRCQPTAEGSSSVGQITLATEAALFRAATGGGIPGPDVHYVLQTEDELGEGFLMQWLDGETLGQRIVHSEELADARHGLARECGEILGRLHALDIDANGLADLLPVVEPAKLVHETWALYRDLDVPVPMIDYAWRWLRDNLPENPRSTLVHGDFRNGNLMVTPQGINAVLDWELAHVGDPVRDLGWLCVNSWRFGNAALPVGGFGEIDELLAGYASTSGATVTREELTFWQVFGSFWWAMATLQMADSWRSGATPSLERPVIGRRSSEAQMDCVNLLIPGDYSLPARQDNLAAGSQLPMPAELLSGVRSFLREQVATQLPAHDGFLARVAANSLGIAQRELLYGAECGAQEQTRLAALLGRDDELDALRRALVNALRDDLPLDTTGLAAHLRQTVACQLNIDQPRYWGLVQHSG